MAHDGVAQLEVGQQTAASAAVNPTYETALLECAAGRNSAVAALYANERDRLHKVARRIVHDRARAEDVIHDAFIQILRDAKTFDPARGSARAWVYTIVRNRALKIFRKDRREITFEDKALHTICDQHQPDAVSRLAEYTDLGACLEELEPKRRASLILAIIDGRTHAEIAQFLRVPVGTVKAWIRRELISLRKRLK